jgi:hypothetical protein
MPPLKAPVIVTVNDLSFTFRQRVFDDLPDARGFLTALLDRGSISPPVAAHYVKLAARLARSGRLADLASIVHPVERTAANAYLKWSVEGYTARVVQINKTLGSNAIGARVRFLRRHSLVQPYPGKMIPVAALPPIHEPGYLAARFGAPDPTAAPRLSVVSIAPEETAPVVTMAPASDVWTLHVPAKLAAPHVDPCHECTAIVLGDKQLGVIAEVVERAWGHRDLARIPPEAYLFGVPPAGDADITMAKESPEKFAAFVSHNATRDELLRIGGRTVSELASFEMRLAEGVEGVYLSREACGEKLGDVLGALWRVWGGAGPAA